MRTKEKSTSFTKFMISHALNDNLIRMFVLISLILMIINATLSLNTTESASELFNNIIEKGDVNILKKCLFKFVLLLTIHYYVSTVIDSLKSMISLIFFSSVLKEGVGNITKMNYNSFHSKGSNNIQETLTKAATASYRSASLFFSEIPNNSIYIVLYTMNLYLMLKYNLLIALAFFFLMFTSVLFEKTLVNLGDILYNFDIILSLNREEYETVKYKKSLKPFHNEAFKFSIKKRISSVFFRNIL